MAICSVRQGPAGAQRKSRGGEGELADVGPVAAGPALEGLVVAHALGAGEGDGFQGYELRGVVEDNLAG